ncbi:hypothetical protein [Turicibacter sanguinis]|uniref:hypothetical protein n=1 Tax=Turicibacter sanguinis TaxID=154288 RepID=UPI002943B428|nr:hypothetical protein [Turicibacter sanguinis]
MNKFIKISLSIVMILNFYKTAFGMVDGNNISNKNETIILDGMIGPYDPNDPDSENDPNFSEILDEELEGHIPDNYYTISVTVPTNMNFAVVSGFGRGQFYSPIYKIENKATRPIHISVVGLEEELIEGDELQKLYLRKPIPNDNYTEIELYLEMKNTQLSLINKVLISDQLNQGIQPNYLGTLDMKQSGTLQFISNNWDVPGLDAPNKHAQNNFNIKLEFSLNDPRIEN